MKWYMRKHLQTNGINLLMAGPLDINDYQIYIIFIKFSLETIYSAIFVS